MESHPVAHRYTREDLDRLARLSAVTAHSGGLDYGTRHDLAWSGIAEYLCTAEEPPSRHDLVKVGRAAIHAELSACMRERGYNSGNTPAGPGASPRWTTYWCSPPPGPDPMEQLIERLAAEQIVNLLSSSRREAVQALAEHDDHRAAADALGVPEKTYFSRLSRGRHQFRTAWYAPDTAPPAQGIDRRRAAELPTRCRAGHLLLGDNLRLSRRRRGKVTRTCRACERANKEARRARKRRAADGAGTQAPSPG